jgi:creatinine amidohydrolase
MQQKRLVLEEMSWPEMAEEKDKVKMVLIPVGSIEQHGPNMTFGTDTALVTEVCRRVAAKLYPEVLVTPAVSFGISYHHMDFPGTITLHPATLTRVLTDIVKCLQHHGFQNFLIVNGHGGNTTHLTSDCIKIREELHPRFIGMCTYFNQGLNVGVGHASKIEVSYGLYLAPQTVKRDSLTDSEFTGWASKAKNVSAPYPVKKMSRNGVVSEGALAEASEEYGKELGDAVIEGLANTVKALINEEASLDP